MTKHSKGLRQQSLRQILAENRILSQDEVVDRMESLGFSVTQSSISRDFKELGVFKMEGRYVVPPANQGFSLGRFVNGVDIAGDHLLVIRTQSGWASAISEAVDFRDLESVVGTIAGENTIFVATKGPRALGEIQEFLGSL